MEKYIERLLKEWTQHGKIIIAVDYDDTISPWRFEDHEQYRKIINLLIECRRTGAYIVVFTACKPDRYDDITSYCDKNHMPIDAINETPLDLPYGNDRKIYANIFLDDRAGLNEAVKILETTLYLHRGNLEEIKLKKLDDIA